MIGFLSPGGRHIIKSEKTGVYFLKKTENDWIISTLDQTNGKIK